MVAPNKNNVIGKEKTRPVWTGFKIADNKIVKFEITICVVKFEVENYEDLRSNTRSAVPKTTFVLF